MPFELSEEATKDISEIWQYIAAHNEQEADQIEEEIRSTSASLGRRPLSGHLRTDLTDRKVRFWTLPRYRNYTIVYRVDVAPIRIIAVLHGKRNISRILHDR